MCDRFFRLERFSLLICDFVILFPVFGTMFVIYNLDSFLSKLYCSNGIFDKLSMCQVKHFHLLIFFSIFLVFSAPRSGDRGANLQNNFIFVSFVEIIFKCLCFFIKFCTAGSTKFTVKHHCCGTNFTFQ